MLHFVLHILTYMLGSHILLALLMLRHFQATTPCYWWSVEGFTQLRNKSYYPPVEKWLLWSAFTLAFYAFVQARESSLLCNPLQNHDRTPKAIKNRPIQVWVIYFPSGDFHINLPNMSNELVSCSYYHQVELCDTIDITRYRDAKWVSNYSKLWYHRYRLCHTAK